MVWINFFQLGPYKCHAIITFVNKTDVTIKEIKETVCGGLMLCIACSRIEVQTEVYKNGQLICNNTGYVITILTNNSGVNVPTPCEEMLNFTNEEVIIKSIGRIGNITVGTDTKTLRIPGFKK